MRGVQVRGDVIRAAREQFGWTQADLARVADVDVKTVRKAEQSKRLDLLPLSRLSNSLKADLQLLILPDVADAALQIRQRATMLKWIEVFNACDGDGLETCFHDDAVMRIAGGPSVPFGGTFHGKKEIRKSTEEAWKNKQEPTPLDEMTIHAGDSVITILGERGVYLPNGELAKFPTAMILTFVGDLISELDVQFDTLDFARRMNLMP